MSYSLHSHKDERIEELRGDLLDAREHIDKLETALAEISDMLWGEADCDMEVGNSGLHPIPNTAMRVCTLIEEVLGKRKA
ncbi:MAG: hypothetical protein ABWY63_14260 [Hyphomicrobiaceae bacterium]